MVVVVEGDSSWNRQRLLGLLVSSVEVVGGKGLWWKSYGAIDGGLGLKMILLLLKERSGFGYLWCEWEDGRLKKEKGCELVVVVVGIGGEKLSFDDGGEVCELTVKVVCRWVL